MANGCWGGEFIKCIKRKVTATHTKRAMAGGSKGAAAIDSAPVTHAVLMAAPGLHTAAQVFGPLRVRCRLAHAMKDLQHGSDLGPREESSVIGHGSPSTTTCEKLLHGVCEERCRNSQSFFPLRVDT